MGDGERQFAITLANSLKTPPSSWPRDFKRRSDTRHSKVSFETDTFPKKESMASTTKLDRERNVVAKPIVYGNKATAIPKEPNSLNTHEWRLFVKSATNEVRLFPPLLFSFIWFDCAYLHPCNSLFFFVFLFFLGGCETATRELCEKSDFYVASKLQASSPR